MKSNNILDPDVDLGEIASLSKNFSGAEIAGMRDILVYLTI